MRQRLSLANCKPHWACLIIGGMPRGIPNCVTCKRPLQRAEFTRGWTCSYGCGACAHCGQGLPDGQTCLACWLCPNCPHDEFAIMEGIPHGEPCPICGATQPVTLQ